MTNIPAASPGEEIEITEAMISAGAQLIQRRAELGKYTCRHLAEDVFTAMLDCAAVSASDHVGSEAANANDHQSRA